MSTLANAADLGARVTLVLGLASLLLLALRRASAATRHLVAVTGLVGALAVPVLMDVLPGLEVPVLPADRREPVRAVAATRRFSADPVEPAVAALPAPPAARAREPVPAPVTYYRALRGLSFLAVGWAKAAWLTVALLLLARLAAGLGWLARLGREATALAWSPEAARCADALGLRRRARLLVSPALAVPVTAGVVDPVLILPVAWSRWSAERRRMVLLHELAHVKRLDWLSLLLCEVAAALWWFHPLAWLVLRAAHAEAEKATDDLVVRAGERPSAYAGHLVDIVRALRGERPVAGAMPMARPSDLEGRLRALLAGKPRGPASPRGRALAAALLACAALAAVARPVPAEAVGGVSREESRVTEAQPSACTEPAQVQPAAAPAVVAKPVKARRPARVPTAEVKPAVAGAPLVAAIEPSLQTVATAGPPVVVQVAEKHRSRAKVEWESARRLEELLADPPASAEPFYEVGKELLGDHDWDGAARAFRESAKRSKRPGSSYYNLACALAQKGSSSEALDALQTSIDVGFNDADLMRTDPDLRTLHGEARFETLLDEAEALELPPVYSDSDDSYWKRGRREREYREAADRLGSYLEAHPRSGRAAYGLGMARFGLGDYRGAMEALGRAHALDYRPAVTLYNLACAAALGGHHEEALRSLERSVEAGWQDASHMRDDDDLESVRDDPRFRAIARRAEENARREKGRE